MARKRRGSVRSGGKRVTERLVKNARHLAEHPEHAVPTCHGDCPWRCPFKRARKGVQRRHGHRGDLSKLKRWSQWGNKMARAYAGVLRIAEEGADRLGYVQNVRTLHGTVPIAPWGKTSSLAHVGMQHHHDPQLRLLMAIPYVRDDDAVYVTDDGLICAHDGSPPAESFERTVDALNLVEAPAPSGDARPARRAARSSPARQAHCPHLDHEAGDETSIQVTWRGDGTSIRICEACAQGNLLARLQRHLVAPDLLDLFEIQVHLPALETPTGEPGPSPGFELPNLVLEPYARGEMSDHDLIEEARRARTFELRALSRPIVVHQGVAHEPPYEHLVETLQPSPLQRALAEEILGRLEEPVVLTRGTAIELLHAGWRDHGRQALRAALGGEGEALYDPDAAPDEIERMLSDAAQLRREQEVAERLPAYASIPGPAALADRVRRALMAKGRGEAQRLLSSAPPPEQAAMAMALVQALDLPRPPWTISPRDRDVADHLEPYAKEVMEAEGEAYDEALGTLVKATGASQEPERAEP